MTAKNNYTPAPTQTHYFFRHKELYIYALVCEESDVKALNEYAESVDSTERYGVPPTSLVCKVYIDQNHDWI